MDFKETIKYPGISSVWKEERKGKNNSIVISKIKKKVK